MLYIRERELFVFTEMSNKYFSQCKKIQQQLRACVLSYTLIAQNLSLSRLLHILPLICVYYNNSGVIDDCREGKDKSNGRTTRPRSRKTPKSSWPPVVATGVIIVVACSLLGI